MTDEQIERIAELVFQKLVKKQEEWDKEFTDSIKDQVVFNIKQSEHDPKRLKRLSEIAELEESLIKLVETEQYIAAAAVRDRIDELKKEL
jgi:protein-arginine kinase activator protein McsA